MPAHGCGTEDPISKMHLNVSVLKQHGIIHDSRKADTCCQCQHENCPHIDAREPESECADADPEDSDNTVTFKMLRHATTGAAFPLVV